MTTPSLVEWLREQLDTDERLARDLDGACWHIDICGESGHYFFDALDSDRLLAEVQSKRKLVEAHEPTADGYCSSCLIAESDIYGKTYEDAPCWQLKLLAEPYRSDPGFRSEWLT